MPRLRFVPTGPASGRRSPGRVEGSEGCVDETLLGVRNEAWLVTTMVGPTFEVDFDGNRIVELSIGEVIPI